ncbi:MAG: thioesterase domain-containing protein, partial [Methylomonas sp.]|nr:thioesterase domain-containing protein [Methylomonas sp.]
MTGERHSIAFLMAYPTVAMQAMQLTRADDQSARSTLCTLSKEKHSTHLYLAASGEGDRLRFQALADAMAGCCMVHMLLPPRALSGQTSLETIAQEYVREIRRNPDGNIFLAGFSIGGVTALETARQLERMGTAPRRLILLDTVYPRWPLQSHWLFKMLQWLSGRLLLNRITLNDRKLQAMLTDPGIIAQLAGLNRHRVRPFKGEVLLIMTDRLRLFGCWFYAGWFRLLGDRLKTAHVPGLHGAMFQARNLPALSSIIRRALQ